MQRRIAIAALLCASVAQAEAARAPWYRWRSRSNSAEACAQASPGAGWQRIEGPFIDAACRRPLRIVPL